MNTRMEIVSVNVSRIVEVERNGKLHRTGIFKRPVNGAVRVRRLGLEGDEQADKRVHGGPEMAVYCYSIENHEFWRRELGRDDLGPGKFGENLTVRGMTDDSVRVGDRFRVGREVELEVTKPRGPCSTLAMAMNDASIVRRFLETCRCGFYCRVLAEGEIRAGDAIERIGSGEGELISEITRRKRKAAT